MGKVLIVIVCGLSGDYKNRSFGQILDLIPLCENVTYLKALCQDCKDGTLASFTKRISQDSTQIIIGGTELYKPVCRFHHYINTVEQTYNIDKSVLKKPTSVIS